MDTELKNPEVFKTALKVAQDFGQSERRSAIIKNALDKGAKETEQRESQRRASTRDLFHGPDISY